MARETDRPGLRSVLARPGYRRLWAARTVSQAGDVAQFATLPLLVALTTGSGVSVSFVVLAEIVPVLLLAPFAGPLVDRLPRVAVMVAADLARVVVAGALAVWHDSFAVILLCAFLLSCGTVFFTPASNSLLPALVEERELVAANSAIWSAAVLVQIVLAPLAALVATTLGFGWALAANSASYAVSALLLRGLRTTEPPRRVTTTGLWTQSRAGWSLLVRDRLLRALAVAQALAALSAGATSALLPVLAVAALHASGASYGLLLSAIAAGAVIGPLLLTRLGDRARRPALLFAALGTRGVVDVVLATTTRVPVAVAGLAVYGVSTSAGSVVMASTLQTAVREDLRGRVFAGMDLVWQGMRLVSLLLGGVLADAAGVTWVYLVGGVLLLTAAGAGAAIAGRATINAPSAAR